MWEIRFLLSVSYEKDSTKEGHKSVILQDGYKDQ